VPLESSAEAPLPVRTVALAIARWVGRLGRVWVEGQITELNYRPGTSIGFLVLRDPLAEVSLRVTCPGGLLQGMQPPPRAGSRVVVWARPEVNPTRGSLALSAADLRPVGVGELLARLERLRTVLAAEGLFAAERKRELPFLPRTVGLVTGHGSAAERDVVDNARRRWPAVRFRLVPVSVQGPAAARDVIDAVRTLDGDPAVDVIVIARGGGSVEDLLPFSDEGLCRAVSTCRTPVVSAIGHESDTPLLDLVADRRASTPTDAAKLVVPDVTDEWHRVDRLRQRAVHLVTMRLQAEEYRLAALRGRPALAAPAASLDRWSADVEVLRDRARRAASAARDEAAAQLAATRGRLAGLSPLATLQRGYAVLQRWPDGPVVRAPADVAAGDLLRARLADGQIAVVVTEPHDSPAAEPAAGEAAAPVGGRR
jgi:exodeoxyribonuclease VII large subunit